MLHTRFAALLRKLRLAMLDKIKRGGSLHRADGMTAALAGFVATTTWDDVPDRERHEAKRALLNHVAVAFAGCCEAPIETALRTLREFSRGEQATVIGHRERADTLTAAFVNAAGSNIFDFCDTHLATVIHPTAPVAPALFALAERHRVSGRDLLTAFVLGYEVECRIGLAISPGHYRRGWHITSTCGVFGAAAAAAKLLGLDSQGVVRALGNASAQAAGLCECLGTPAKSISVGNAARNGLLSALLAEQGFGGPAQPIEGTQGYLNAVGEVTDPAAPTRGLGESWEIRHNACKPYPCGIVIHPILDGVLALQAEAAIQADAIDRVVVRGHPLLRARTDRPDVSIGREAQVSLQHAVAAALLHGGVRLEDYSDACVQDPTVAALRARIQVVDDETIAPEGAVTEMLFKDGTQRAITVEHALGSAQRPMSDGQLEAKLSALATPHIGGPAVQKLITALWALDRADDAAALMQLTVPTA
jgi:2-methylcitrate dehydratase PrpD